MAVQNLTEFKNVEAQLIDRFEHTTLSDERAESLMLRAYDQGIVSHYLLPKVIKEWRMPAFNDFQGRTLWSLFNAFTTVLGPVGRSNPQRFASLTMRLQHLIDSQPDFATAT